MPGDAEHRAALHVGIRKAAGGQRQDQPAAILEPIEPDVCRPSRAGIDEDYVGGLEPDPRAVAVNNTNISLQRQIRSGPLGQYRIELDRGDRPARPTSRARIAV